MPMQDIHTIRSNRATNPSGIDFAYSSLITCDNFLPGIEMLVYSWQKTQPKYPLVLLYTQALSRHGISRLQKLVNVQLQLVDDIPNPNTNVHVEGWVNSGYTKLHIFNLVQYDRIIYLDADCLVLENIDELFISTRSTHFAAAPDVFPPDRFNAGVLVIQPDLLLFQDLLRSKDKLSSYDGGDTGFLNAYFSDWYRSPSASRLPFRYNAQRTMYWITGEKNPGYWQAIQPIKILHFSSNPKPWDNHSNKKGLLEMKWWEFFIESQTAVMFS